MKICSQTERLPISTRNASCSSFHFFTDFAPIWPVPLVVLFQFLLLFRVPSALTFSNIAIVLLTCTKRENLQRKKLLGSSICFEYPLNFVQGGLALTERSSQIDSSNLLTCLSPPSTSIFASSQAEKAKNEEIDAFFQHTFSSRPLGKLTFFPRFLAWPS